MGFDSYKDFEAILKEAEDLIDKGDYKKAKWKVQTLFTRLPEDEGFKPLKAEGHSLMARIMVFLSDNRAGEINSKKAIKLAKEIGNERVLVRALRWQGDIYQKVGRYEEALKSMNQALEIVKRMEDKNLEGIFYNEISKVFTALGELERAEFMLRESVLLLSREKDREELARTYNNLGDNLMAQVKFDEAIGVLTRAIKFGRGSKFSKTVAFAYYNIAECLYETVRYEEALDNLNESFSLFKSTGNKLGLAICNNLYGLINARKENWKEASECFDRALKLTKLSSLRTIEARTLWFIGKMNMWKGDKEKAIEYMRDARKILEKHKPHRVLNDLNKDLEFLEKN